MAFLAAPVLGSAMAPASMTARAAGGNSGPSAAAFPRQGLHRSEAIARYQGEFDLILKDPPKAGERLAVQPKACGNCKEYSGFKEKIADYGTNQQSRAVSHFESSVT